MEKIKVGDKVVGFDPNNRTGYMSFMGSLIGEVGTVSSVVNDTYIRVEFDYYLNGIDGKKLEVTYPLEEAIDHLVKEEKNYEQYIGRKMRAFKFLEIYKGVYFTEDMIEKDIEGEIGEICSVQKDGSVTTTFRVRFTDGHNWSYPCELAIPHIINGEIEQPKIIEPETTPDMVNSPAHYGSGVYELCNVMEAYGFENELYLGQALQYIVRYNKKGKTVDSMIEDLEKSIWNINRKIKLLKESKGNAD